MLNKKPTNEIPKCQNCKSPLGCSCKIRVASDGKSCCTKCINQYEASKNKSN